MLGVLQDKGHKVALVTDGRMVAHQVKFRQLFTWFLKHRKEVRLLKFRRVM